MSPTSPPQKPWKTPGRNYLHYLHARLTRRPVQFHLKIHVAEARWSTAAKAGRQRPAGRAWRNGQGST
ncbi:hypothetical protein KOW79_009480 [Hemibagrus wyckioides]|uniref:Uncharacterized protein n=1 Tax=Hemibagrus wyckioides TaxID=337641 RepID=A0A9D3SQC9_9TELE|nr:hypothetical protein KOW79_009480 [Hemibagrus wyckioides]